MLYRHANYMCLICEQPNLLFMVKRRKKQEEIGHYQALVGKKMKLEALVQCIVCYCTTPPGEILFFHECDTFVVQNGQFMDPILLSVIQPYPFVIFFIIEQNITYRVAFLPKAKLINIKEKNGKVDLMCTERILYQRANMPRATHFLFYISQLIASYVYIHRKGQLN